MKGMLHVFGHVLLCLQISISLSGHVCSKQKAETYSTNYDRAFICPERYTTACGQLDWRRCTKYRVSTCYTPTQKYAIRYLTVEVCCPGWRGDTCSDPICPQRCQNGGICSDMGGHPGCQCSEGFYGELCENARNRTDAIEVVLVCFAGLVAVVVIIIAVLLYRHRMPSRISQVAPYTVPTTGSSTGQRSPDIRHFESHAVPSAPHFST